MILDVFVLGELPEDEAQYLLELFLPLRLHIAPNVLGLMLQLPFEAGVLLSRLVDREGD
jgi:hypothetical protein